MQTIDSRFEQYHADNPTVYEQFKRFTFELIAAGVTHFSSDAIIHKIRFETAVRERNSMFKINNNYSSHYSRLFMKDYPQYDGFFETRELKAA